MWRHIYGSIYMEAYIEADMGIKKLEWGELGWEDLRMNDSLEGENGKDLFKIKCHDMILFLHWLKGHAWASVELASVPRKKNIWGNISILYLLFLQLVFVKKKSSALLKLTQFAHYPLPPTSGADWWCPNLLLLRRPNSPSSSSADPKLLLLLVAATSDYFKPRAPASPSPIWANIATLNF